MVGLRIPARMCHGEQPGIREGGVYLRFDAFLPDDVRDALTSVFPMSPWWRNMGKYDNMNQDFSRKSGKALE